MPSNTSPLFDISRLEKILPSLREQFLYAKPFPHLVLEDFLKPSVATEAYQVFPKVKEMDALKDFRQVKCQDPALGKFDPIFKAIIDQLNASSFMNFVSQLTGINDLLPDDQLYAGGLAQGGDGSFLNTHIDNSSHPVKPWYRRVNIIVYLNKLWTEPKGGHVEFWDKEMKTSAAILPTFNRAVIFGVGKESWHGYRKVTTPDGDTRKSINLYYFTKESPTGEDYYHVTSFRGQMDQPLLKYLYPVDNLVRGIARKLRPHRDRHAILYDEKKERA